MRPFFFRLPKTFASLGLMMLVLPSPGCGTRHSHREPVRIFAAASLSDAVLEVAELLRAQGGPEIEASFAGSNTLVRQILAGAPADLMISADRAQVDVLVAAGRAREDAVEELFRNALALVVPAGAVQTRLLEGPEELLRFRRIAVADPEAVPAGVYARRWLEGEGLWEPLRDRLVPAADVRAALAAVSGGHLEAGLVYASDAAADPRVRTVYRVAPGEGLLIRYVAVPLVGREAAAAPVLAFLTSSTAQEVFRRHGFLPLGATP